MRISADDWNRYINRLAKVNEAAANQMREYIRRHGTDDVDALIQMANAIATKYGEAAAAVTCDMYDAIAEAQGAELAPAVPAMTPSIEETGNVVRSAMRRAPAILADEIGKLVKKTSTRTMRKNAARDDALMALVPSGDGCPFCKMLGSRGWESARASKSFEAHLHAHCRCEYVVRFSDNLEVEGYDPEALYEEFQQYEGSWNDKMNAMRREQHAESRETINRKKMEAHAVESNMKVNVYSANSKYTEPQLTNRLFKHARFKSPLPDENKTFLDSLDSYATDTKITASDLRYISNNIHQISSKKNIGKVVTLSSFDYVYVIEMIDYLEYNVLWKIPNDDNLNDAIARKRRRR